MAPLLPLHETVWLSLLLSVVGPAFLRLLHPYWWRLRHVLIGVVGCISILWMSLIAWAFGSPATAHGGVITSWVLLVVMVPATVSLLPAATIAWILGFPHRQERLANRVGNRNAEPAGLYASTPTSRRAVLQAAVVGLPLTTAASSAAGFVQGARGPRVRPLTMKFAGLHPDLEGFKILQLSDLHLGYALVASDVEKFLCQAREYAPDLVVVTGDVADNLDELAPCLRTVAGLQPRCGAFAALGNHEYLGDIDRVLGIFSQSDVALLVRSGTVLDIGRTRLYLAGADDRIQHDGVEAYLEQAISQALEEAPTDCFRLLLCHRPEGFPAAATRGVHLTLSGHTHGGQVRLGKYSIDQTVVHRRYVWGQYRMGKSLLYTTSGLGDWFPFRLGCPREAPLIRLSRA